MEIKMTNRDALDNAIVILSDLRANGTMSNVDAQIVELVIPKLTGMLDALDRKTASKKPTPKQQENECRKQNILDVLRDAAEPMRCADIGTAVGISGNQASALLSQLVKAEVVERSKGPKGVSLFSLRAAE